MFIPTRISTFVAVLIFCVIIVLGIEYFYTSDNCLCWNSFNSTFKDRYKDKFINGVNIFKESRRAHRLLDGLIGIEIGASSHNSYGLTTINIDYTDSETPFNQYSVKHGLPVSKVQIVTSGDNLPFTNDSIDFVISSHVIEHFWDPIKAIEEWLRVVKPNGYVYIDIPHKERTFDKNRDRTTLAELLKRHNGSIPYDDAPGHKTVWITEDVLELAKHFNWNVVEWADEDDKTKLNSAPAIGFTIVLQKNAI